MIVNLFFFLLWMNFTDDVNGKTKYNGFYSYEICNLYNSTQKDIKSKYNVTILEKLILLNKHKENDIIS